MQAERKVLHVRKGDNVKILAGKDKGKTGKIASVDFESGRVVVDGANIIIKHQKSRKQNEQSSRNKLAGTIDSSNVQILCPSCGKPTRVAKKEVEVKGKQKWIRVCKKCTGKLDVGIDKKPDKKPKKVKGDEELAGTKAKTTKSLTKKVKSEVEVDETPKAKKGDGVTEKNSDGAIV